MGKRKFSESQKTTMIAVYKIFKNYDKARSKLWKVGIHVSVSGLKKVVLRARKRRSVKRQVGSGRPRKSTIGQDRRLVQLATRNRRCNLVQLANSLHEGTGARLSAVTVSRRLAEKGLSRLPAKNRPFLNQLQRTKRLEFALEHQGRTIQYWRGVKFSDEKIFSSENFARRPLVTRKPSDGLNPACISRTVKWGFKLHVWGMVGWDGVGPLRILEGTLTAAKYVEDIIFDIRENLVLAEGGHDRRAIFQQDLAPAHAARRTQQFLDQQGILRVDWPGNSPDLNPIEHVWADVSRHVRARGRPNSKAQLAEWVFAEWDGTSLEFVRELIRSMRRRISAVIASEGDFTHY